MKRLLLTVVLLFAACSGPSPIPTPYPDAGPPDVPKIGDLFTGALLKCSTVESNPLDAVRTCLDASNTGACLLGLADPFGTKVTTIPADPVVTAIGCTVRSIEMDIYPKIAKGTATDREIQEARNASAWINERWIGFYAE